MKNFISSLCVLILLASLSGCALFGGGGFTDSGGINIGSEDGTGSGSGDENGGEGVSSTFTADIGSTDYSAITMTNTTEDEITITAVEIENNVCQDFWLYSLVKPDGTEVASFTNSGVSIAVAPSEAVVFNVAFTPSEDCTSTDYSSTLEITYNTVDGLKALEVTLVAQVGSGDGGGGGGGGGGSGSECSDPTTAVATEDDVEELTLAALTDLTSGNYFLRIDAIRAIINSSVAIALSTDVETPTGFQPNYEPIYLPVDLTVGSDPTQATITLPTIEACQGLIIETDPQDANLAGLDALLTTSQAYSGTVDLTTGEILLTDFTMTQYVEGFSTVSGGYAGLINNPDCDCFQADIQMDFTTGQTVYNEAIEEDIFDGSFWDNLEYIADPDEGYFNFIDTDGNGIEDALEGVFLDVASGNTVTLVAIANFVEGTITTAPAVLQFIESSTVYTQLEGTLMQAEGGSAGTTDPHDGGGE